MCVLGTQAKEMISNDKERENLSYLVDEEQGNI